MAYFALIDNSKVQAIHVVADAALINDDGEIDEALGQQLLEQVHGVPAENWVQCSLEGEFRGSQIGIGFNWDSKQDVFIAPQPFPSWSLTETFVWSAPVPYPEDGRFYFWDEDSASWIQKIGI